MSHQWPRTGRIEAVAPDGTQQTQQAPGCLQPHDNLLVTPYRIGADEVHAGERDVVGTEIMQDVVHIGGSAVTNRTG